MIIILSIVSIMQALFSVWLSQLIGQSIELMDKEHPFYQISLLLLGYVILTIITSISQFWIQKLTNTLSYRLAFSLRQRAHQVLVHQHQAQRQHGKLSQLLTNEIEAIAQAVASLGNLCFTALPQLILTLIFMLATNIPLTLVVLFLSPLMIIMMYCFNHLSQKTFDHMQQSNEEVSDFLTDYLSRKSLVQFFNQEENIIQKYRTLNQTYSSWSKKAQWLSSLTNPTSRFIDHLIYLTLAGVAGLFIIQKNTNVGMLSTFILYATQFTKPFIELTALSTQYQTAKTCMARYTQWITKNEVQPMHNGKEQPNIQGDICFQQVDFSYDKPLFHQLSCTLPYQKKTAIIGPTGAGKSTLIQLLLKLEVPQKGTITIHHNDLQQIDTHYLRQHIGVVFQEPWIFHGTLRENLCLYKSVADQVIWNCLKQVDLFETCQSLENQLDTVIDHTFLSKGEQQLLTIARNLIANPDIIILDEATSAMDEVTEQKITAALEKLMENKTVIIVAHHLATIKNVDYIITLENGKITEQGSPQELLAYNSYYRHLQYLQGETYEFD